MKKVLLIVVICFMICSCSDESNTDGVVDVGSVAITCSKTKDKINEGAILIDVRSKEEYDLEHLDNAINIPLNVIKSNIGEYVDNKEIDIILYCQSGNRSSQAAKILLELGYTSVYDLGAIKNCNGE